MTTLYVVDTNVVVAALLTPASAAPPAAILERMLDGSLRFLLSPALLAEYRDVLLRPRLARRHALSEPQVDELLVELAANGALREPGGTPDSPDPKDAHLLALLDCEPQSILVTGDELLLKIPGLQGRALTPRQWADSA